MEDKLQAEQNQTENDSVTSIRSDNIDVSRTTQPVVLCERPNLAPLHKVAAVILLVILGAIIVFMLTYKK